VIRILALEMLQFGLYNIAGPIPQKTAVVVAG
jgi:hypothetical protein